MRYLKWFVYGVGTVLVVLLVALAVAMIVTAPGSLPEGTESAARLAPGPYPVGRQDLEWVDVTRATAANGNYPGSSERVFPVTLWYPKEVGGAHPLLVFTHGIFSTREGCAYLAEHLASHGYVVVSADFPLTHFAAPGGPDPLDVVNQPADVSFLIDRTLGLEGAARPFEGEIDLHRIGAFGISLGAATTTLVAFHPEWRDPRIAAAISIAGPGDVFGRDFFDHADVPFLMIAGTADPIVDFETNALPIPERIREGGLVTIEGATHAGFTNVTSGLLRVLGNPDHIGCGGATAEVVPQEQSVFVGLFGTPEQGLIVPAEYRPPCGKVYDDVLVAGRQQMMTMLAVFAFFESQFALTEAERAAQEAYLAETLPREIPEVTYTPSRRG